VALVGFTAAVVGDNIGFAIGTYGGRPLVERYGRYVLLTRERLDKAEEFFNRQGGKIVIVARFIEGLRQLNGIIAGISDMAWRRFLGYNAIGAALWVGCWTSVGYFGGEHIELFHKYLLYFSIIGAALIVGYVVYLWWHNKNKTT
ncbi:MAG TPA: DedA family protein, partial [Candidatus Saccharimonadales bacterium]|nr:DedA family protein [Candidatus Saccharimonadales bacterium]